MNDVHAALRESDHANRDLSLRGVEIFTRTSTMSRRTRREFWPLFTTMQDYDVPILLCSRRTNTTDIIKVRHGRRRLAVAYKHWSLMLAYALLIAFMSLACSRLLVGTKPPVIRRADH